MRLKLQEREVQLGVRLRARPRLGYATSWLLLVAACLPAPAACSACGLLLLVAVRFFVEYKFCPYSLSLSLCLVLSATGLPPFRPALPSVFTRTRLY